MTAFSIRKYWSADRCIPKYSPQRVEGLRGGGTPNLDVSRHGPPAPASAQVFLVLLQRPEQQPDRENGPGLFPGTQGALVAVSGKSSLPFVFAFPFPVRTNFKPALSLSLLFQGVVRQQDHGSAQGHFPRIVLAAAAVSFGGWNRGCLCSQAITF